MRLGYFFKKAVWLRPESDIRKAIYKVDIFFIPYIYSVIKERNKLKRLFTHSKIAKIMPHSG